MWILALGTGCIENFLTRHDDNPAPAFENPDLLLQDLGSCLTGPIDDNGAQNMQRFFSDLVDLIPRNESQLLNDIDQETLDNIIYNLESNLDRVSAKLPELLADNGISEADWGDGAYAALVPAASSPYSGRNSAIVTFSDERQEGLVLAGYELMSTIEQSELSGIFCDTQIAEDYYTYSVHAALFEGGREIAGFEIIYQADSRSLIINGQDELFLSERDGDEIQRFIQSIEERSNAATRELLGFEPDNTTSSDYNVIEVNGELWDEDSPTN